MDISLLTLQYEHCECQPLAPSSLSEKRSPGQEGNPHPHSTGAKGLCSSPSSGGSLSRILSAHPQGAHLCRPSLPPRWMGSGIPCSCEVYIPAAEHTPVHPLHDTTLHCMDYFELWVLENQQIQGELSVHSLFLPKDRASTRNSAVSPSWGPHQPGRWTLDSLQERTPEVDTTLKLSQTSRPPPALQGPGPFPKTISSCLRCLPPSPSPPETVLCPEL